MEGFRKPPLPPPRSPSASLWRHNANHETGNAIDRAVAEIQETQTSFQVQQLKDIEPSEVSRVEGLEPAHDKKLKRILASREYSRRYHFKQLRYVQKLEKEQRYLEAEVAVLPPRINFLTQKNMLLQAENDSIKQKLAACEGKHMERLAETEKLLRERDPLQQLAQMQQAEADFNPQAGPDFMAFDPPVQLDWEDFGLQSEPNYQPFNPPAGLDSETVDFADFYAAQMSQMDMELPGLDAQFSSEPVDEPFGFSEFSDELVVIVNPDIMSNNADQVGAGDYQSIHSMNLNSFDDFQNAAGSSSDPLV